VEEEAPILGGVVAGGVTGGVSGGASGGASGGMTHEQLSHQLHVCIQTLWHLATFRTEVLRLPSSSDPLVSGVQTLLRRRVLGSTK
jgi:hypothetical protein